MAGIEEGGGQKSKKHIAKNHDRNNNNNKHNTGSNISQVKPLPQHQQQGEEAQPAANNKKKKRKQEVFPFGNYKSYYGYRIGSNSDDDPRLKVLKKEWFLDKDCLDIGCNAGIITIQIALMFECRTILGVDIDHIRIKDADWNLRKFDRLDNDKRAKTTQPDVSLNALQTATDAEHTKQNLKDNNKSTSNTRNLLDRVSFRQENFIHARHPPEKHYDAILCLSVSKWIHLNWGDDGLITLFSKIWRLLRPGGVFILEPQPWKSYENNRQVSEPISRNTNFRRIEMWKTENKSMLLGVTQKNYRNIMLRPERFQEILLDKVSTLPFPLKNAPYQTHLFIKVWALVLLGVDSYFAVSMQIGFRMVEDLSSCLSGSKAGFNRPIFAFHK
ncbi:hypothetical protein ACFE04_019274 [Oxalis oulophora]